MTAKFKVICSAEPKALCPTEMSGLARQVAEVMDALCARLTRRLNLIKLPGRMTPERVRTLAVLDKQGPLSVTALAALEQVFGVHRRVPSA